jgi:hypothetical protein
MIGALGAFVVILAVGGARFGEQRWSRVARLALWAAVVLAVATLVEAAPADSASCGASSDCDTSFGLGMPFLVAAYWLPAFVVAAIGARPRRHSSSA